MIAPPCVAKAPEEPVFTPKAVTTPVPVVTVAGAAPAPPPTTKAFAASAAEVAQVLPLEKYGIPPDVPATVKAGVDVAVATVMIPPVKPTLVTVPEPLLLNVVQSDELNAPRLVADAVGTFKVITGVDVPVATVELKSVPDVAKVSAATEVTVPAFPAMLIEPEPLVIVMLEPAVSAARVYPVPLPISNCPLVGVVVNAVPPLAIGNAVPE
jgi:hypothetical protein